MDPRIAIWNTLHDGEITVTAREGEDLVMFVSVPYIRERLKPLGDSFVLRLCNFRDFALLDSNGTRKQATMEADVARSGIEILSAESDSMPVKIATNMGYLVLNFDSIEISLDTGQSVSYGEVLQACEDYWTEWSEKGPQPNAK